MTLFNDYLRYETRRQFLGRGVNAVGWAALASLLGEGLARGDDGKGEANPIPLDSPGQGQAGHLSAHGRRAAADGPVRLQAEDGRDVTTRTCPTRSAWASGSRRMTSGQARFPIAPSKFKFAQHGKSGMWVSRAAAVHGQDGRRHVLHPQHAHRGHQPRAGHHHTCRPATRSPAGPASAPGRPTAWARSTRTCRRSSCWSPSRPTPSRCRPSRPGSGRPATCPASTPASRSARPATRSCTSTTRPAFLREVRRKTLDGLKALNEMNYQTVGDPETHTRIQQYELAFRMQASVPELTDLAKEPETTFKLYGDAAKKPGTFANTALLARRHGRARRPLRADLPQQLGHARQRRRPAARPVPRRRPGLLRPDPGPEEQADCYDSTLVIWGGEFGRTIYSQGGLTQAELRPRPSPALLHHVDGRRRLEAGHASTARPTTSPTTSSRTRSTSTTSTPRCCTCWASTTAVHLPLPGARPAADRRRAGQGGQGAAGVIAARQCPHLVVQAARLS